MVLHIQQMPKPMAINQVPTAVRLVLKNRIAKIRMTVIAIEKRTHIIIQMAVVRCIQMASIVHRFERNWD